MASMKGPAFEPTLPKLKVLNESKANVQTQLLDAVNVAGLALVGSTGILEPSKDFVFASATGQYLSNARLEGVLRWLLEKLKAQVGSNEFVTFANSWQLLTQLVENLPAANAARILNANSALNIVEFALEQSVRKFAIVAIGSNGGCHEETELDERKHSRKRKRDQSRPSPVRNPSQALDLLRAISTFLSSLVSRAVHGAGSDEVETVAERLNTSGEELRANLRDIPIATELMKSVLRTETIVAAKILGHFLRCLSAIMTLEGLGPQRKSLEELLMSLISPILKIWEVRSHEVDDSLGSSAEIFSKECLVPATSLYSQLTITPEAPISTSTDTPTSSSQLKSALEQLFARHIFMPARAAFSSVKRREKKSQVDSPLHTYLETLKIEISLSNPADRTTLIRILPLLLEEAIKLSPRDSPKQKEAEIPWIENVLAALSYCAGEPIPFPPVSSPLVDGDRSPLPNMLHVIHQQNISLTSSYLENILVDYSGLILREHLDVRGTKPAGGSAAAESPKPQWRIISMLLQLDGNIFLKKHSDFESQFKHTPYVDALAKALANGQFNQDTRFWDPASLAPRNSASVSSYPFNIAWDNNRKTVVDHVVIPLMDAYKAARDLTGFMNLWFRELRRDRIKLNKATEDCLVWTSKDLRHAFWDLLQDSLTAGKINEQIIEYVLPVKELADEVSKEKDQLMDWSKYHAVAPALPALFMLDVILHGIDREDILQQHLSTFLALTSEITRYTKLDLTHFSCASKVWSVFTQLQELAPRVLVTTPHVLQREKLLASGVFDTALETIHTGGNESESYSLYLSSQEAYRFVVTLSLEMVEFPSLKSKAEEMIIKANEIFIRDVNSVVGEDNSGPLFIDSDIDHSTMIRIIDVVLVLIQYPQCLKLFSTDQRCKLFYSLFYYTRFEKLRNDKAEELFCRPATPVQTILDAVLDAVVYIGSYSVIHDLVQALTGLIPEPGTMRSPGDHLYMKVALDTMLKLSPAAITRKDREAILDKLSIWFLPHNNTSVIIPPEVDITTPFISILSRENQNSAVALMLRALSAASATAQICVDADILWSIASGYNLESDGGKITRAMLEAVEELFNAVLKQALADPTLPRTGIFSGRFTKRVSEELAIHPNLSTRLTSTLLIKCWFSFTSKIGHYHPSICAVASEFYASLNSDVKRLSKRNSRVLQKWVLFKCLADFPYAKLGLERTAIEVHSNPLMQLAIDAFDVKSSENTLDSHQIDQFGTYADLLRAVAPLQDANSVITFTSKLLSQKITPRARGLVLHGFQEWLQTLRPAKRVELFSRIISIPESDVTASDVEMVHLLIKTLTQEEMALSDDLNTCLGRLCLQMQNSKNVRKFGSCIDCINTILRMKQWLVSQYGIDTLLGALTAMSSSRPSKFQAQKEHAGFIYMRLCQTTTNILILHRKRTGGRFHLLVPLLQNLLSCLFKPHSRSTSPLPPWLHDSSLKPDPTYATAYSRILTTLSSPTSSSTSSKWHNTTPILVDENKKAKLYAGQYVSYILMHYCSLQLSGTIEGEVKDALKSGFWSLMDVVDMEGMRGMNAGMGRDERVMWGSLYTEWNRYGKGKGRG